MGYNMKHQLQLTTVHNSANPTKVSYYTQYSSNDSGEEEFIHWFQLLNPILQLNPVFKVTGGAIILVVQCRQDGTQNDVEPIIENTMDRLD